MGWHKFSETTPEPKVPVLVWFTDAQGTEQVRIGVFYRPAEDEPQKYAGEFYLVQYCDVARYFHDGRGARGEYHHFEQRKEFDPGRLRWASIPELKLQ